MNDVNLKELWRQSAEKEGLEAKYRDLKAQRRELAAQARQLEQAMHKEQADVDRLEGRSLAAFFYQAVGRMDEKLDKERQEAMAARVRYDAAARQLAAVDADLQRMEARLRALDGCEARYREALARRMQQLRDAGGPAAQELHECETRLEGMRVHRQELEEALQAGQKALPAADAALESLDSAHGWGTWDLVGGGLVSDLAKYGHLDDAQEQIERLQVALRRFKTELADVEIDADVQVTVDGFLKFADFFFDNLFTDWAVLDRIGQSQQQVQDTRRQIERVLARLKRMAAAQDSQMEDERERLEQIAREAEG